jgi:hypothetical protein
MNIRESEESMGKEGRGKKEDKVPRSEMLRHKMRREE